MELRDNALKVGGSNKQGSCSGAEHSGAEKKINGRVKHVPRGARWDKIDVGAGQDASDAEDRRADLEEQQNDGRDRE